MMKNKIISVLLIIFMVASLSGCQLAKEDLSVISSGDRLIGVFISYEYIDLFDVEAYFNNNAGKLANGEIISESDSNKYSNRLYATLVEEEMTTSGGEKYTDSKYVFEGCEGISMFAPTFIDSVTGDSYISSFVTEEISDTTINFISGDTNNSVDLFGTVYIYAMTDYIYINPVYQSDDGSVYLQSGSGFGADAATEEGEVFNKIITETTTSTKDNISATYTGNFKVTISVKYPAKNIIVYEMDKENTIISKTEFTAENAPESIVPSENCEYFIVESYNNDANGEIQVKRKLFSKEDGTISFFKAGKNDIVSLKYITVIWEDKEQF